MAIYFFETISAEQALAYNAAVDSMLFTASGATAAAIRMTFNSLVGSIQLTDGVSGRGLAFGQGVLGERDFGFPDGSVLSIGTAGGDHLTGEAKADALFGADGADTLEGGAGADVLDGGAGADVLTGGDGADLFVFQTAQTSAATPDVISDWSTSDRIEFPGLAANGGVLVKIAAASLAAARTFADVQIARGAADYVVASVGGVDTYLFVDSRDNNGEADDVVRLDSRYTDVVSVANIVGARAPEPITAPPPSPPPAPDGAAPGGALYDFGTITAAQALAFDGATDRVTSTTSGYSASATFNDAAQTVTITDQTGRSVTFGSGIYNAELNFRNDSSWVYVGSPRSDLIVPHIGSRIFAGSGDDTIISVSGHQIVDGGAGRDLFVLDAAQTMRITDWEAGDRLHFSVVAGSSSNYFEGAAASETDARALADQKIATGVYDYVAVTVGANLYVYADNRGDNEKADVSVVLSGRTLSDIDFSNIVGGPAPTFSPTPTPTPNPTPSPGTGVQGYVYGDMDSAHLSSLLGADITENTATALILSGSPAALHLLGAGFTYDANDQLTGGTVNQIFFNAPGGFSANVSTPGIAADQFGAWVLTDATRTAFSTILAGADRLTGGLAGDLIRGFAGDDQLVGGGGADTIYGGLGNDVITASNRPPEGGPPVATYLRGEEGNDVIQGGGAFDDINGNAGNDTCTGGANGDWVVGGKDNDSLSGDGGDDLVYGNLGSDTCGGGAGNDIVRGGQDDDLVQGGAGDDWLSGDRGDDTITGDFGADVFHTFGEAGIDRVTDFQVMEGDRVQLDPGTQYSVAQVGADAVISMTGGGQMILVGVQLSSLQPGWIFGS